MSSGPGTEASPTLTTALQARMQRPQRHRLLQGYPAVPLMGPAVPPWTPNDDAGRSERGELRRLFDGTVVDTRASLAALALTRPPSPEAPHPEIQARWAALDRKRLARLEDQAALPSLAQPPVVAVDPTRSLIVGVLPHTQCTPRVEGCGFCTFPHDAPTDKQTRGFIVNTVRGDIAHVLQAESLKGRAVDAVYFGGGTANLTAVSELRSLFGTLAASLDLRGAEVSLEGIPALFTSWFHAPLKMLAELPVRRKRISMGVQTFDRHFIEMMGRQSFGDQSLIQRLVRKCRSMDIGTSGDFLFNLPGQTLEGMSDDVDRAVACGFDQICLYNLVLYKGLGTLWSEMPLLVDAMPSNDAACAHWLSLRTRLLSAGYVQTTLTNFERSDVASGERAFVYERASFSPERTDGLGFGPLSISTFIDSRAQKGLKLLRRKNMSYRPWSGDDLFYVYGPAELRVLFVTRSLAKASFSRAAYTSMFQSEVLDDFSASFSALQMADLINGARNDDVVSLTPRGMFYSDSVVATFATEQKIASERALGMHTTALLAEPLQTAVDYYGMG